jgi:hypothetical protein
VPPLRAAARCPALAEHFWRRRCRWAAAQPVRRARGARALRLARQRPRAAKCPGLAGALGQAGSSADSAGTAIRRPAFGRCVATRGDPPDVRGTIRPRRPVRTGAIAFGPRRIWGHAPGADEADVAAQDFVRMPDGLGAVPADQARSRELPMFSSMGLPLPMVV